MNIQRFLCASALVGVAAGLPTMAYAQTTSSSQTTTPTTATDQTVDPQTPDEQKLRDPSTGSNTGDITIVGSRIRRNEFNTAEPITIITKEETTLQGFASTGETLQGTAVTTGASQINNSYTGLTNFNGGPGGNTLSLRGLGATRTLILLNGRRLAPSGAQGFVGSADLNVLPNAIIDRIEVLKAGASSVYGSDAIAGVVNIVTDTKFKGLTLSGQSNFTQDGGGGSYRLSAVAGVANDRYNLSASFDYFRQDPLTLGQRSFSQCQQQNLRSATNRTPGSADLIDPLTGVSKCYPTGRTGESGVSINAIGTNSLAASTVALAPGVAPYTGACNRFRPNAAAGGAIPGYECVGGGSLGLNIRDTFDKRLLNVQLISPVTNYTGFLHGGYQIGALGNAEVYVDVLASRRNSNQLGFKQLSLDYLKGSPLIPANLQFSTFGAAGTSISNPASVIGVRAFTAFGNYSSRQKVDDLKASGGVRGDFFLPSWRYDAYGAYSFSDARYTVDQILTTRLGNSLDAIQNADGSFSCRSGAAGCVAAPVLTPAVVGGQFPQAWLNYIVQPVTGRTTFRETTGSFTVDGPIFRLPGGDLQAVLGAEFRRSKINDQPGADSQAGNTYNSASSKPTVGSDEVWEAFGEVELPLLRDLPWMHSLTLNGSGRYTHYRSYGGQWTYKVSGIASPVRWFSVRGSYGTSYRAPALFEQYLGASSGFSSQTSDPCYQYGQGYAPTDPRYKNCASEGLAPDFIQTSSVASFAGGGSATGLKAETSTNWTVGGILQIGRGYDGFGSLSFSADYFNIDIKDGVARAGVASLLSLCYDDPGFRTGGDGYCALVTRNATTKALSVNDNYTNVSEDKTRGIDFDFRYAHAIGSGRLVIDVSATKYFEQASRPNPTSSLTEFNGTLETPSWSGTLDATYSIDKFKFRYGVEYIQSTQSYDLYGLDRNTTPLLFDTPDYFTHSASMQVNIDKFEFTMGVRNLFNKTPPTISSSPYTRYSRLGNAPLYSGYDIYGRRFFVNATTHF